MGLDMYLYAERRFEPDSEDAQQVLKAAGRLSLADLQAIAANDPMADETSVYLGRWSFMREREADKVAFAEGILTAAGLWPAFDHEDANSGYLGWADGQVFVSITAAYWRKANAVHAWFVDNCQGGVDECQLSDPIDGEQLAHLRSKCVEALTAYRDGDLDRAATIMAPRSGFFFGGYDIDQWWAEDLADTVKAIERCIRTAIEVGGITFRYHSSW